MGLGSNTIQQMPIIMKHKTWGTCLTSRPSNSSPSKFKRTYYTFNTRSERNRKLTGQFVPSKTMKLDCMKSDVFCIEKNKHELERGVKQTSLKQVSMETTIVQISRYHIGRKSPSLHHPWPFCALLMFNSKPYFLTSITSGAHNNCKVCHQAGLGQRDKNHPFKLRIKLYAIQNNFQCPSMTFQLILFISGLYISDLLKLNLQLFGETGTTKNIEKLPVQKTNYLSTKCTNHH